MAVTLQPLLLLGALLCWPSRPAVARLRTALGERSGANRLAALDARLVTGAVVVGAGLAFYALLGPAGAVVGVLFGASSLRVLRSRRKERASRKAARGVADALGALAAELRTGAHPALAAERVAVDADSVAATGLNAVAAASRLGGDVETALTDAAGSGRPGSDSLMQAVRAWRLAQRHGLPLADVLDAVRRDLDASERFAGQLQAKLAGPRASAAVLAGLPVVGVLLGEAMGAQPLAVLSSTGAGQALLVLGGVLVLAGVAWSERVTRKAVTG